MSIFSSHRVLTCLDETELLEFQILVGAIRARILSKGMKLMDAFVLFDSDKVRHVHSLLDAISPQPPSLSSPQTTPLPGLSFPFLLRPLPVSPPF